MQTAYNMNSLYAAGVDGSGQTVVITDAFGSSTITEDADLFSQIYGLPRITPDNFQRYSSRGRDLERLWNFRLKTTRLKLMRQMKRGLRGWTSATAFKPAC